MENKQTAVEWLEEKINLYDFQVGMASMRKYIEYAKAMEKEQIMKANDDGFHEAANSEFQYEPMTSEQYYEKTYGTRQSNN